jgi:hypothetical protein
MAARGFGAAETTMTADDAGGGGVGDVGVSSPPQAATRAASTRGRTSARADMTAT